LGLFQAAVLKTMPSSILSGYGAFMGKAPLSKQMVLSRAVSSNTCRTVL
jgi:hypothetical protein